MGDGIAGTAAGGRFVSRFSVFGALAVVSETAHAYREVADRLGIGHVEAALGARGAVLLFACVHVVIVTWEQNK